MTGADQGLTCRQGDCDIPARPAALVRDLIRAPRDFEQLLPDKVLRDRDALVRRPGPAVWSALEYVAHTRDAVGWYEQRIRLVLSEPGSRLEPFDWDRACEERRYRDEAPQDALAGLSTACRSLAVLLGGLDAAQWDEAGIGSSDGGARTVLALARRAVHEARHHLWDVERCLAADRRPPPLGDRT